MWWCLRFRSPHFVLATNPTRQRGRRLGGRVPLTGRVLRPTEIVGFGWAGRAKLLLSRICQTLSTSVTAQQELRPPS